jgi:hypothetical protein
MRPWLGAGAGLFLLASGLSGAGQPTSPTGSDARVVTVRDPLATVAFRAQPQRVRPMVDRAITNLARKATLAEAWRSFARTQDVIGIKVYSRPGPGSGTRAAVVAAVVEGLLATGWPPQHIIVWDKDASDLRSAGFFDLGRRYGIRVESSADAGYDEKTFYESVPLGKLIWGDLEFGKTGPGVGRKSFVSKLLTQKLTRLINITPLLNHNSAGVSGNLYGLATGSVDNVLRFENDADRLAVAVPELYALPALGDRVVLNLTDALLCQYEGGEHGLLHYSTALNELRFSTDPVALDVLSLRDLVEQRQAAHAPAVKTNQELYDNAALLKLGVSDLRHIVLEQFP